MKRTIHKQISLCKECGELIKSWPSQKRVFCSIKCHNDWQTKHPPAPTFSKEEKEKRKNRMLGKNNPMWCGGDSDRERRNSQYKQWRIDVFERDNYTCQKCGYINGRGKIRKDLNAHHIVRWIESIELRYAVENGITLCVPCHMKAHKRTT